MGTTISATNCPSHSSSTSSCLQPPFHQPRLRFCHDEDRVIQSIPTEIQESAMVQSWDLAATQSSIRIRWVALMDDIKPACLADAR